MRLWSLLFAFALIFMSIPAYTQEVAGDAGTITADTESVRLMLTAPDNQNFNIFEETSLISALIDIVENDPTDAEYHDRVVDGALKVLAEHQAPEAVDLLIANIDNYPPTCLYWLGTYPSTAPALLAMTNYLTSDNASYRYEAATAISILPMGDPDDEEWTNQIWETVDVLYGRIDGVDDPNNDTDNDETDTDVQEAITAALRHIMIDFFPPN